MAEVLREWESIDILVNSAGIGIRGPVLDYEESDWDRVIAVNLKGTFLTMQIVGRHMVERGRGKIINLASIGAFVAYPESVAYLAAKGGVAAADTILRTGAGLQKRAGERDRAFSFRHPLDKKRPVPIRSIILRVGPRWGGSVSRRR